MWEEVRKHKLAYFSLSLGLGALTVLYLAVWPNLLLQRVVILGICAFYTIWGITTHLKTDHFTPRVAYEYIGISLLGGLLLFLITI